MHVMPVRVGIRVHVGILYVASSEEVYAVIALTQLHSASLVFEITHMCFPFRSEVEGETTLVAREDGGDSIHAIDVFTQAVGRQGADRFNGDAQWHIGWRRGRFGPRGEDKGENANR